MSKVTITNQKSNLERFYQGWPHFTSMNKCENFIVFKTNIKYVESTIKKALQRISDLKLPLEVLGAGERSNTFIVKEREARNG